MPGPYKGFSTQCTTQQQYAKPRHQPSDRDQRARDRLRNKVSAFQAKIKSPAYIALGAAALQTVYQTFDPDLPMTLHLLMLPTKTDTNTIPMLFVIQEDKHCMPTSDYYFTSLHSTRPYSNPSPQRKQFWLTITTSGSQGSNSTMNRCTEARQNQSLSFHAS